MRIPYLITTAALIVAAIVGCSKSSNRSLATAATVLELSTNTPSHVTIDSGHDCIITTTAIPGGQLLLHVDFEVAGSVKSAAKIVVSPGQEFTLETEGMAAPVRFKAQLGAE
jgi:hypothetical protein